MHELSKVVENKTRRLKGIRLIATDGCKRRGGCLRWSRGVSEVESQRKRKVWTPRREQRKGRLFLYGFCQISDATFQTLSMRRTFASELIISCLLYVGGENGWNCLSCTPP